MACTVNGMSIFATTAASETDGYVYWLTYTTCMQPASNLIEFPYALVRALLGEPL